MCGAERGRRKGRGGALFGGLAMGMARHVHTGDWHCAALPSGSRSILMLLLCLPAFFHTQGYRQLTQRNGSDAGYAGAG